MYIFNSAPPAEIAKSPLEASALEPPKTKPPPGTLKGQYIFLYFDPKLNKPNLLILHLIMLGSPQAVILKVNIAFVSNRLFL